MNIDKMFRHFEFMGADLYMTEEEYDKASEYGKELVYYIKELETLAVSLCNTLPDCVLDWSRDCISNSNVSSIQIARDKLLKFISK